MTIEYKRGRQSKRPTADELNNYYKNHTAKETAQYYGVAEITVARWISYYRNLDKKVAR